MSSSAQIRIVLCSWLFLAITASEAGMLAVLPTPGPQVLLFGLTIAVLAAYRTWPALHGWISAVPIRLLLAFHLIRFVGIYFLYLHGLGRLPYEFAVYGGWGDIFIATSALLLLGLPNSSWYSRILGLWNIAGLADILYVILLAAKHNLESPGSMAEITHLPLSLLPLFIVPLIISTHLFMMIRLSRAR